MRAPHHRHTRRPTRVTERALARALLVAALLAAVPASAPAADGGLHVVNVRYVQDDLVIWGFIQHNGWWQGGKRANLTRRAPLDGDVDNYAQLDVRPNKTEDLAALADNMVAFGYPGFEHNFGLWFDRRRDAHDTVARSDDRAVGPFLEQPWARSGSGTAWDGLSRYDLETFNEWYFDRLREFAALCDEKGTILFHNTYMQHALLEDPAHYVDFPWRPVNNVNGVDMPDAIPAANSFYDIADPHKRALHRLYIRKTLDALGEFANVVHLPGQEYTGPLDFVQFWMDTILEWEAETGIDVHIGLGATKDVLDAILEDPILGPEVSTVDLRDWWYNPDGSLFAPSGGVEEPGRFNDGLSNYFPTSFWTTPGRIYQQVREYRDRYPGKAIIHAIESTREQTWAFFMGGGSMLIHGQVEYENSADPPDYEAPPDWEQIQPAYTLARSELRTRLVHMVPSDLVVSNSDDVWLLSLPGSAYLAYSQLGDPIELDLTGYAGKLRARWLNPRTGEFTNHEEGAVFAGRVISFLPPSGEDWALLLTRPQCGAGPELLLLVPLFWARRRRGQRRVR